MRIVPIATIDRQEDEYFIRGSAVAVNDRAGSGQTAFQRRSHHPVAALPAEFCVAIRSQHDGGS